MEIYSGKITQINNNANTKYGRRSVLNVDLEGEEVAVWAQIPNAFRKHRVGNDIDLVKDLENNWSIFESSTPILPKIKEEAKHLQDTAQDLLQEGDLPLFSQTDMARIRAFLKNQALLMKDCHRTVLDTFPEIVINDPRGARSMATTLMISVNQRFQRRT